MLNAEGCGKLIGILAIYYVTFQHRFQAFVVDLTYHSNYVPRQLLLNDFERTPCNHDLLCELMAQLPAL